MQSQHRILVASNFYPPDAVGGAEVVAARQARAFSDAGHSVAVFAGGLPRDGLEPGALEREWDHDGDIPVYRVGLVSLDAGENFFRPEMARRFSAVLAQVEPDIVHFHNVVGLGTNLIPLASSSGAKVFVTLHDHWAFCFKNTRLRNDLSLCTNFEECALCQPRMQTRNGPPLPVRLRRDYVAWCLGHADRLISPSRYLADAYEGAGLFRQGVQALSNGIDDGMLSGPARTRADRSPEHRPVRFLCAAYLGPHKGIGHLLAAAEKLAGNPEYKGRWRLTICGHGDLSETITHDIARGRFGDAVELAGRLPRTELLALMDEVDAIVLPSIWPENEPVSMLEAIAKGKAQIATRIGGNVDLVEHGMSGLLVEPGNSDDLAAAMERLVRDPGLSQIFGKRNLQRRDRFSETATIKRLLTLYDMPAMEALRDEFVVACVGSASQPDFDSMLHVFHLVENEFSRVRFIHHEWVDAEAWASVDLVWIWPDSGVGDRSFIVRAIRSGIPVLAEANSPMAEFSGLHELPPFRTLHDALGTISALAELPRATRGDRTISSTIAGRLTTLLPQDAFNLDAEMVR